MPFQLLEIRSRMNTLWHSLLVTSFILTTMLGGLTMAAPAGDNYQILGPRDVRCGITNFSYDGVMDGPRMVKPMSGKVGLFLCENKKIELASPNFEDGFIITRDYGKVKVRFGMSLSGTLFTLWMTPGQKAALIKLRQQ